MIQLNLNRVIRFSVTLLVIGGLTLSGCSKCGRKPTPKEEKKTEIAPPENGLSQLDLPPGLIACAASKSVDRALKRLATFGGYFGKAGASFGETARPMLAHELGLKDTANLDLTKPARAAFFDPTTYEDRGWVLLLALKNKNALIESLRLTADRDTVPLVHTTSAGAKVFFNFVGNHLLATKERKLATAHEAVFKKLIAAPVKSDLAIAISVKNLYSLYGSQIEKRLDETSQAMKQAGSNVASLDLVKQGFAETDRVDMVLNVPDQGARIETAIYPQPGTEMERIYQSLHAIPNTLLSRLPAGSPLVIGAGVDMKSAAWLVEKLVRLSVPTTVDGKEISPKFTAALTGLWRSTDGQLAFSVHDLPEDGGTAIAGLYGLKSADEARKNWNILMKLYQEPAVSDAMKQLGVRLDFDQEAYRVKDIPVATSSVDMGGTGVASVLPFAQLLISFLTTHYAFTNEVGIFSLGPQARKSIEGHINGTIKGGLDQTPMMKDALSRVLPGTFAWLYVSPAVIARQVMAMFQMATIEKKGTDPPGLVLGMGTAGNALTVGFDFPSAQAKAIGALISGIDLPKKM